MEGGADVCVGQLGIPVSDFGGGFIAQVILVVDIEMPIFGWPCCGLIRLKVADKCLGSRGWVSCQ
jgi:hypothetical protein